jgi:hypothetical protein
MFDTYKCKNCGATGKRYGLSPNVRFDKKYDKPKWIKGCPAVLLPKYNGPKIIRERLN